MAKLIKAVLVYDDGIVYTTEGKSAELYGINLQKLTGLGDKHKVKLNDVDWNRGYLENKE